MYRDFKDVPTWEAEEALRITKLHANVHDHNCPGEVVEQLAQLVATHTGANNLRVARVDDDEAVKRYVSITREGCCEEMDCRMTVDGVDWLYGCNFDY